MRAWWRGLHVGWKIVVGVVGLRLVGMAIGATPQGGGPSSGVIALVLIALCVFGLPRWLRARDAARRREALAATFGSQVAEAILQRNVWQGQTQEMLLETQGAPAETARQF